MLNRLILPLLLVFWGAMTWLLVRSEFGDRAREGAPVPVERVWMRLLKAPDESPLEIRHRGRRIGNCRWNATVGQALMDESIQRPEDLAVEGRVREITSYSIDLEGMVSPDPLERTYRYQVHFEIGTNHQWRVFAVQVVQRPFTWLVEADALAKTVRVLIKDDAGEWERKFNFDDFKRPEKLLAEFGVPWAGAFLSGITGVNALNAGALAPGLKWDARQEWFPIGKSQVRAYRIAARLFDRHEAALYVGRSGEILRIELPEGIVAVNEGLLNY